MDIDIANYYECLQRESLTNDCSIHPTGLNEILVKCKLCKQVNIERDQFRDHIYQTCQKAIVTCSNMENSCSWIGLREEYPTHLTTCSYASLSSNSQESFENTRVEEKRCQFLSMINVNIQQRHFSNQDSATAVKALLINQRCTSLDLFNKGITSHGATVIASVLDHDVLLDTLSFRNNLLCDSGVQYIAHALVTNTHLQRLDLNDNSITDTGVRLLADMLKTNGTLVKLTLSFNRITNEGLDILLDVLSNYNSTLQWLSLAGNSGINDASTHSITRFLAHNRAVTTLNLEDCQLSWWSRKQISLHHAIHFKAHLDLLL